MTTDAYLAERVRTISTLRALAAKKTTDAAVVDLVRGPGSLASLMDAAWRELYPDDLDADGDPRGRPAKPSARFPDPFGAPTPEHGDVYFNGRYDVWAHGPQQESVIVDSIQIETTRDARESDTGRRRFARAMALAVQRFFSLHHDHEIRPGEPR